MPRNREEDAGFTACARTCQGSTIVRMKVLVSYSFILGQEKDSCLLLDLQSLRRSRLLEIGPQFFLGHVCPISWIFRNSRTRYCLIDLAISYCHMEMCHDRQNTTDLPSQITRIEVYSHINIKRSPLDTFPARAEIEKIETKFETLKDFDAGIFL